ncbi:MED7 domain containing protein [Rhypophila sp. PSN 637]
MAEVEQDPFKVTALYPDPPPFWKAFTADNIAQFDTFKQQYAARQGLDVNTILRIPDIPEDLTCLQPPAEPEDAKWKVFNEPQSLDHQLQSLEAAGIQRLASEDQLAGRHMDRAFELKRIAKSMLLNFLELIGLMGHNMHHAMDKVEDLRVLFLNFHHYLNEYRPHQAREQLIQLMQDQLDAKRAETAAIRAVTDKAKRALEGLGSMDIPPAEPEASEDQRRAVVAAASAAASGLVQAPAALNLMHNAKEEGLYWARESDGWSILDGEYA